MIPLAPALLVAAANAFVGRPQDGNDSGVQVVELVLPDTGQGTLETRQSTFVHHVGYWSHYDDDVQLSSWPLPATKTCQELASFARRWRILTKAPEIGDVFMFYFSELGEFGHPGIIVNVNETFGDGDDAAFLCTTVEAGGIDGDSGHGIKALRKVRWFSIRDGDRFVRWADMELRAAA